MKTIEVGAFEAKNRLSQLLAHAERGQRIYITRRGQRIALLTSAKRDAAPAPSGRDRLKRFQAFRAQAKRGPESLKQLVDEGR